MINGYESMPFLRLITMTSQSLRSRADQWLKRQGLTIEQFIILKELLLRPRQMQRTLSISCSKSAANITRILDRLEKKKYIIRDNNPEDRRSSLVELTEAGKLICDEVDQQFQIFSDMIMEGIDGKKQAMASEILNKVIANLDQIPVTAKE